MLTRRIIAAAILGASTVLGSLALVHARSSSAPSQAAQLATTVPEGTPPPFPFTVLTAPVPPEAGGKCALRGMNLPPDSISIAKETTIAQLAADTDQIVVATAVRQVAYWQNMRWGDHEVWQPLTTTEFHVTDVVKGTPGAWVQDTEPGASSDAIPTCKDFARTIPNENVAKLNQQYVLFLKFNAEEGRYKLWAGPMDIFPVISGRVYTAATVNPGVSTQVVWNFHPEPLERFLAALRPSGSSSP
jgi:hypothetical protein